MDEGAEHLRQGSVESRALGFPEILQERGSVATDRPPQLTEGLVGFHGQTALGPVLPVQLFQAECYQRERARIGPDVLQDLVSQAFLKFQSCTLSRLADHI